MIATIILALVGCALSSWMVYRYYIRNWDRLVEEEIRRQERREAGRK